MTTLPFSSLLSLDWVLLVASAWLLLAIAGLVFLKNFAVVARVLFPASAVLSIVLAAVVLTAVIQTPQVAVLPLGLPSLPFHFRLDALAAFFVMLLGLASAGISVFVRVFAFERAFSLRRIQWFYQYQSVENGRAAR